MHGGTARVESEGDGKGATFTVEFPLVAQCQTGPKEAPSAPELSDDSFTETSVRLDGVRILVVDDEKDARELMVEVLRGYGAEVDAAPSALDAFEAIRTNPPSALVSDIAMPEEDGYSLIRRIRNHDDERVATIPAVAVTAYARLSDRVRALSAGFQSHLSKPVEPSDLATTIATLVNHPTASRDELPEARGPGAREPGARGPASPREETLDLKRPSVS